MGPTHRGAPHGRVHREDTRTKQFAGRIAVDIRDSEPDWTPYLAPRAPEGAPIVLLLAWDDLGYATMDTSGGPVQCPNMARIAEFASGFPGISTRFPFESGFTSEVLAEHGYNTYCVGKWTSPPARSATRLP